MRLPLGQSAAIGRRFIDLSPELRTAVIQTVELGWQLAKERAEVLPNADEVTLTECLRDAMRMALVSCRLPWRKTMIVAPGTESRSQAGMTAPDGRTDIPIYLTRVFVRSGEHDPHAIIECKRVAESDTALAREYVIEGIDRFRTGKYAENHSIGFMVGYVIAGSRAAVVDGINKYLIGKSRRPETLSHSIADGWTSKHPRSSGSTSIALHHAMLAVT